MFLLSLPVTVSLLSDSLVKISLTVLFDLRFHAADVELIPECAEFTYSTQI